MLIPLNKSDFKSEITFQPICGTLTAFENFFIATLKIPSPFVFPSADELHISCIPKQIPKTGCFNVGITLSKPLSCSIFIAELASPTPGKIILSAALISSILFDKTASTPKRLNAN